ncbi:MAG: serine hydrolase domain-containing protein [Acidobacteriota bacterium]
MVAKIWTSLTLAGALTLGGCAASTPSASEPAVDIETVTPERAAELRERFSELLDRLGVVTAGAAVIQAGELTWTGYYGEQSPGVPASSETLFDVASMTKPVAAETILRLASQGVLSLDEPMATHWVDPDLADDPRHESLTPRMALNHTTGFPNWRFFLDDGKLRFLKDPGTAYGYSGEGFDYVMRWAEKKLGRDFPSLMADQVFKPVGMGGVTFSVRPSMFHRMARPVDADGVFHGHYCRPNGWCRNEGAYSAADDLRVTIEDYAKFLISAMNAEGLSAEVLAERNSVRVDQGDQAVVDCTEVPEADCPLAEGFGLGWEVIDFGDHLVIGHGGSDWSEVALGYFYSRSQDGLLLFFNAPNHRALGAMGEAIGWLDPDSPYLGQYRRGYEESLGRGAE